MKFVCGHIIHFKDGGPPSAQALHVGTLEECQSIGAVCLAVSYSGSRPVDHADFVILPITGTDELDVAGPENQSPQE